MDAQADLRLCCSHMTKAGFLMTWLILAGKMIQRHHHEYITGDVNPSSILVVVNHK